MKRRVTCRRSGRRAFWNKASSGSGRNGTQLSRIGGAHRALYGPGIECLEPRYLLAAVLVGEWHLNEGSGLVAFDTSGYDRHATIIQDSGTPTWGPGVLNFAGPEDNTGRGGVDFPNFDGSFTVEARFRLAPEWEAGGFVVSKWGPTYSNAAWGLGFNGQGQMYFEIDNPFHSGAENTGDPGLPRLTAGQWHEAVGVFTAGEMLELYVDGVLYGAKETTLPYHDPVPTPIYIGNRHWSGSDWNNFLGDIDYVRLYEGVHYPPPPGKIIFSYRTTEMAHYDLWSINPDGTELTNLTQTPNENEYAPSVSPDATQIAYMKLNHADRADDGIYVMSIDGLDPRQIVSRTDVDNEMVLVPLWLDSETILFSGETAPCRGSVYQVDAGGGPLELLFSMEDALGQGTGWPTDVSPDGGRLAAAAQGGCWAPTYDVYLLDTNGANGSALYEDTPDDWRDINPKWSPDGQHIAFTHWYTPHANQEIEYTGIAMIELDGTGMVMLTPDGEANLVQDWSPDGQSILHLRLETAGMGSGPSKKGNLYRIDPEDGEIAQVTNLDGWFPTKHTDSGGPLPMATWYQPSRQLGAIRGTVWNDRNADGAHDESEPGLASVPVAVYRDDGDSVFELLDGDQLVSTVETAPGGEFEFPNLNAGFYWVDVDESSTQRPRSVLTSGSDPLLVDLEAGQIYDRADFGYLLVPSIGDLFVDDNASNDPGPGDSSVSDPLEDGSLERPFDAIQEAIDAASDGDVIVVMGGTYQGDGNRDIDVTKHVTIRSMDPADPSVVEATVIDVQATSADQHRGFYLRDTADGVILAGLTVTGGYTDYGGAVRTDACEFTIEHSRLIANTATVYGGAVHAWQSAPTLTGNTIESNVAANGGGVSAWNSAAVALRENTIHGNQATNEGGGIYARDSAITVADATAIDGNTAGSRGGGMNLWHCSIVIDGATVSNNTATNNRGGGIAVRGGTEAVVRNSLLSGNAASEGGAITVNDLSHLTLENNQFFQNVANAGAGGGLWLNSSLAFIQSNLFQENAATAGRGGGIWLIWSPSVLQNNVFWNNSAFEHGTAAGGYSSTAMLVNNVFYAHRQDEPFDPTLAQVRLDKCTAWNFVNTIFWGDVPSFNMEDNRSQVHLYHVNTPDGIQEGINGNISAAPGFADPLSPLGADDRWGTDDDGFRLSTGSPCRDVGTPAFVDADGSRSDMGAYGQTLPPGPVAGTLYVDDDNTEGPWDGSALQPYQHIWEALWVAENGATINVGPGTYHENLAAYKQDLTLVGAGPDQTIIDGDNQGPVMQLLFADGFDLSGFKLTRGYGAHGGAMTIADSDAAIHGNVITANRGVRLAGGVMIRRASHVRLLDNEITDNRYGNWYPQRGGGIIVENDASAEIVGNLIARNRINGTGGGIWARGPSTIRDNVIVDNYARDGGGGMLINGTGMTVENNVVARNTTSADGAGGGIYVGNNFSGMLANLTVYGNTGGTEGGGLYVVGSKSLHNSIVWNNAAPSGFEVALAEGAELRATYSDIQGGWPGTGNMDVEPRFADPIAGDYHLRSTVGRWDPTQNGGVWVHDTLTSPCIDGGNPESPVGAEPVPNGGRINMGAYGGTAEASKSSELVDVPPEINSIDLDAASIDESGTVWLNGTFTNPDVTDTHQVWITWDDGSTETLHVPAGHRSFAANHTYFDDGPSPGNGMPSHVYTIAVTLSDDDGGQTVGTTTVTVNNVAPEVTIEGAPQESSEQIPIDLSCVVTDPGTDDTFTYAWIVTKDGDPYGSGAEPAFSFTPDDPGVYVVTVEVVDDDGGVAGDSRTITITDVTLFYPIILDGIYTERHTEFDDGSRGFSEYYDQPQLERNGVPFQVKLAGVNTVSTQTSGPQEIEVPLYAARTERIHLLGLGTHLTPEFGHGDAWCDDADHFSLDVHYSDGSVESILPTDVVTGLSQWADVTDATGQVDHFAGTTEGYVHHYYVDTDDSKSIDRIVVRDKYDGEADFTFLAMSAETDTESSETLYLFGRSVTLLEPCTAHRITNERIRNIALRDIAVAKDELGILPYVSETIIRDMGFYKIALNRQDPYLAGFIESDFLRDNLLSHLPDPGSSTVLRIHTNGADGQIFVDNLLVGAGHYAAGIDPGEYTVSFGEVLYPCLAGGSLWPPEPQTVQIVDGQELVIEVSYVDVPPDEDGDGIADAVEDGAPNAGDGNRDGVADRKQANVCSFPKSVDGQYVTLATPEGTALAEVGASHDAPFTDVLPGGIQLPLGLIDFTVEDVSQGGPVMATLILPPNIPVNTYYMYGPTPDNSTPHWYDFLYDGITGAQILDGEIVLRFVDGQRGDHDVTANGRMVALGGPGHRSHEPIVDAGTDGASLEGEAFIRAGSFTDPDAGDSWTATVDYGDGSGPEPLTLDGNTFSLSHVYADEGQYPVAVTVQDSAGASGQATLTVNVVGIDRLEEVTAVVYVEYGRSVFNRRTGQQEIDVIVTNTSAAVVEGPLAFVVTSISNSAVTLANPTGQTAEGHPFVELTGQMGEDGLLSPGEATAPFTLRFNNPARARFTFQSDILGASVDLQVTDLDVQSGPTQRSLIQQLDVTFDQPVLGGLIGSINDGDATNDRIWLQRFELDGSGVGEAIDLAGKLSAVDRVMTVDFGQAGLGGSPSTNAADGYYKLSIDLDGNLANGFDDELTFYRLLGNVNADRVVDEMDVEAIALAIGTADLEKDINGDGAVTATDRELAEGALGRQLAAWLQLDD